MNVGLLRLQSAPIWKYLQGWWDEAPDFAWVPTGGSTGFVDLVTGIPFQPTNGAVVVPGGIVNPADSTTPVMLSAANEPVRGASYWGAMSLVSGTSSSTRGMILKIGNGSTGLGLAVGAGTEASAGTQAVMLREGIAWVAGTAGAWVDGCNAAWLQNGVGSSVEVWPNAVGGAASGSTGNAVAGNMYINGRLGSSSPFTVHCVFLYKNRFTTSGEETAFRLRLVAQVQPLLRMPREQIMRMFIPSSFFIPTAAAAGGGYTLTADSGTFTNTGGDASFVFTRKLAADSGTFAYTGGDAGLKRGWTLAADSGTFSYSGGDATFTYSGAGAPTHTLASDSGTFSYSGGDATLAFNRSLAADYGTFAYTGGDANFTRAYTVAADGGTFAYSGGDATFLRTYVLDAESGTFTLNGGDATLTYSGAPVVVPTPQTGGGRPARKQRKRQIQVEIDGEVINVESVAEAEEVLAKAAEEATETAKLAIERAAKAKRRPVRKIVRDAEKALTVPEISVPPSLRSYADQMIGRIRAEYQSAISAIEIAAHMARREREIEDDDEEVLMLL